jgi:hypothetical protein
LIHFHLPPTVGGAVLDFTVCGADRCNLERMLSDLVRRTLDECALLPDSLFTAPDCGCIGVPIGRDRVMWHALSFDGMSVCVSRHAGGSTHECIYGKGAA